VTRPPAVLFPASASLSLARPVDDAAPLPRAPASRFRLATCRDLGRGARALAQTAKECE
jgi:hypothetical protein